MLREDPAEEKNTRKQSYYDLNGDKVIGEGGFVTRIQALNDRGQAISENYFDADGNPMSPDGMYYQVEFTYDKKDNVNREKYYDADGNLVLNAKGYAIVYREFDAYNRVVYERFAGTGLEDPQLEDGAFSYRYEYDDHGELIKKTAYDWMDHEIE